MTVQIPASVQPYWPALELILEGHTTLGEMCGGTPTLEDVQIMSIAAGAWRAAESAARKPKGSRS